MQSFSIRKVPRVCFRQVSVLRFLNGFYLVSSLIEKHYCKVLRITSKGSSTLQTLGSKCNLFTPLEEMLQLSAR